MKETKYVFDANVLINMQRNYPIDVFSSLWKAIEGIIDKGDVISCDMVFDEIATGGDDLVDWAKVRKTSFLDSGEAVQNIVRKILIKYPTFVTGRRNSNNADPFVIAHAKLNGYTLVSDETRVGKDNPPRIPNICDDTDFNVRVIKYVDFLRELKIKI